MPLAGKAPASNSDSMTLISKTHKMEGENSHKLSLDIYTSSTVHMYISALALCICMCVHTHVVNLYSVKMQLFHVSLMILVKSFSACILHFYYLQSKEKTMVMVLL